MRGIYTLATIGAQPFLRRKLARRGVAEPGYLQHIDERFGRYVGTVEAGALWIHAVSLGETRAAAILIDRLRRLQPDIRMLLTHGTATGRAEGEKLLRSGDLQAWQPWDTPKAVRGFLDHFRPAAGVLMETEVWPNLVANCRARGVALALANARLSQKSLDQAQRLSGLSRPAYAALDAVWAQTESDAQRLAQAGARVTGVYGNLKFDAQPNEAQLAQGRAWRAAMRKPVVMFASSREGEEARFLHALRELPAEQPGHVQWMIVPRHPQRFGEVAALVQSAGFSVSRRSEWAGSPVIGAAGDEVWIGDSLGEMALYYGLSDVALLGGSFEPLGGQNLIEAAACGCPVVMGPHTFNFEEASRLSQEAGAAFRVRSMDAGLGKALELTVDVHARRPAVDAALRFTAAHRGAAEMTARSVVDLIKTRPANA